MAATPALRILSGMPEPFRQELHPGSQVIGRAADADIVLASDYVSEHHAELRWEHGEVVILDLGSRNGTWVNGDPVRDRRPLAAGDEIRLGTVDARLEAVEQPPGRRTTQEAPAAPATSPATGAPSAEPTPIGPSGHAAAGARVFVSYSRDDERMANAVVDHLRRARWEVWQDLHGIRGGEDWSAALTRALRATDVVVVLVTDSSMRSEWVRREVRAADRAGIPILPVVVDAAPVPDELALIVNDVQRVDVHELEHAELRRIEDDLTHLVARPRRAGGGGVRMTLGTVLMVVGVVLLVVAFGVFLVFGFQFVSTDTDLGFDAGRDASRDAWLRAAAAFPIFVVGGLAYGGGRSLRRSALRRRI
ncbi:MAG: TIR domain-containing protein [Actinomycetota bacterium]|nr:TIR domain-containing protein [Actinomycetota bacterium]